MGKPARYSFAGVELDTARRQLLRGNSPIALQKKPLDLLIYLIEHRDRAVGKDEILQSVWPDEFVTDSSLAVCVAKIRKALGEDSSSAQVIETLHGFGYRLVAAVDGPAVGAAGHDDDRRPAVSTVVGRDRAQALLRDAWAQARAGERSVVLVSGDGGIGKTALVQSFLAEIAAGNDAPCILRGECLDLRGGSEPFLPLLDAWTRACRGKYGGGVIEVLRRSAPGWLLQLDGVVATDERTRLREEARGTMPERVLRTLGSALNELAALHPTILVIEDLHWADPATIDALARIAHDREPAALLVLATLRPEFSLPSQRPLFDFVALLERKEVYREIALERLDELAVRAFLENEAPALAAQSGLCARLYERTRGHPLFLHGAVRHLTQGGRIDEVPATLRRMIEVEIDSLATSEQRLVEAAGLVGSEFAAALVAAALEEPLADVEESLLDVVRQRRVLEPTGDAEWPDGTESRRFRFRHPYYVDVVLDRAARSRQRLWHARIAERLRAAHAESLPGSIALRIASHFDRAGDVTAALLAYEKAVTVAQQEYSYERIEVAAVAALAHLYKLPASTERDDRELALRMALGPALVGARGYVVHTLRENCERCLELARAIGAVGPQFFALLTLSAIHQTRGEGPAARAQAEELVALAESSLPAMMQQLARARLGQILAAEGELERAREHIEAALGAAAEFDIMRDLGVAMWVDPGVALSAYLGNVLLALGYPDQANRAVQAAVDRATRLNHRFTEATAQLLATCFHILSRDDEAAYASSNAFVEIARREGLMEVMENGLLHCLAQVIRNSDANAVERFGAALQDHERRGILHAMPFFRCIQAEALARCRRPAEGLAALDAAVTRVAAGGEKGFLSEVHRLRGESLASMDSADGDADAEAAFGAAIDIARSQGARWFELRATAGWARLLHQRGRGQEAHAPLAAIVGWFTEGFATPDLREAAALLQQLETAPQESRRS